VPKKKEVGFFAQILIKNLRKEQILCSKKESMHVGFFFYTHNDKKIMYKKRFLRIFSKFGRKFTREEKRKKSYF